MHLKLQLLQQFWTDLRAGRPFPARRDFKPEDLKPWLGHIALLDVEPGPRFRVRLAGVTVVEFDGRDLTGTYLDESVPEPVRETVMKPYGDVLAQGAPVYCRTPAGYAKGSFRILERLLLPLSGNGRDIDMIMAGLYPVYVEDPDPIFSGLRT